MIATCGSDKKIIVHKMITKEFLSDIFVLKETIAPPTDDVAEVEDEAGT